MIFGGSKKCIVIIVNIISNATKITRLVKLQTHQSISSENGLLRSRGFSGSSSALTDCILVLSYLFTPTSKPNTLYTCVQAYKC